ncbi:MAG: right-handed parallel beta-helix repeat-containing protein [Bacteroidales bacterium]|nr:right-handed parallel beta-helix repeat-containing protein [Bacteroidales bacterium]
MKDTRFLLYAFLFLLLSACSGKDPVPTPEPDKPDVPVTEWYVSPDGNDQWPGTAEQPFRTLAQALTKAGAGKTVYLKNGTWKESAVLQASGSASQPFVLAAAPGQTPVLDGGNGTGFTQEWRDYALVFNFNEHGTMEAPGALLQLDGASHVVIRGITFTGSRGSGIFCGKGASGITVENCTVTDCLGPGICFGADGTASSSITVRGNIVKNCAQRSREAISLRTVDGFEVAENRVEKVIKESIDAKSGCRNGSIHHNTIVSSGHCAIYLDAGYANTPVEENIEVYCNEIRDPLGTGICVSSEQGNAAAHIRIYNNLVYTPLRFAGNNPHIGNGAGIKVGVGATDTSGCISDVTIYQNTVIGTHQQGIYVNYPNVQNIVIANNISGWNDVDQAGIRKDNGPEPAQVKLIRNLLFGKVQADAGEDAILKNPNLSDPYKGNLKLTTDSPAVDAADERYTAKTDFAGRERPSGKASDIGAYELVL